MRFRHTAHRAAWVLAAVTAVACSSNESGGSLQGGSDVRESPDVSRARDLGASDQSGGLDAASESDVPLGDDATEQPDAAEPDDSGGSGAVVCDPPSSGYGPTEICDDGLDNDHDGDVDEDCPCSLGATQACFPGDPAQLDIGQCLAGVQICTGTPPTWGECLGGFIPSPEVCDDKDNDCDGCVDDELIDCIPSFSCPVEETARPLSYYTLDGPAILDIIGATGWSWSVVPPRNSGTDGPEDPTAATTRVFLDVSGDYLVSVTATDEKGQLFGCSWIVSAQGDGLRVELNWDTMGDVDLDLHLHRSGSTADWCSDDDCYYANCNVSGFSYDLPSWGYASSPSEVCISSLSSCPNPRLDLDNIRRASTPENINIDNPNPGDTFRIMVHNFSQETSPTRARVSIYCGGELRSVLGEAPREAVLTDAQSGCQGDTWRVADVRISEDPDTGAADCRVNPLINGEGDWDIRNDDATYYP